MTFSMYFLAWLLHNEFEPCANAIALLRRFDVLAELLFSWESADDLFFRRRVPVRGRLR